MWKCHKCGKPVYFAERKQSLGYNWHPECLRCEECGKRLNPGQHAEHKGVPYCHVPCYGALFGPQLFGHGTRVESHKSFGLQRDSPKLGGPVLPRSHLDSRLKVYNQFFEGKSGEIRSREVNGRLILEGSLRIYWGVQGVIHLKEDDDQRTVVTVRRRNSSRRSSGSDNDSPHEPGDASPADLSSRADTGIESGTSSTEGSPAAMPKSVTLPSRLDVHCLAWDELDELLQVERRPDEGGRMYSTLPEAARVEGGLQSMQAGQEESVQGNGGLVKVEVGLGQEDKGLGREKVEQLQGVRGEVQGEGVRGVVQGVGLKGEVQGEGGQEIGEQFQGVRGVVQGEGGLVLEDKGLGQEKVDQLQGVRGEVHEDGVLVQWKEESMQGEEWPAHHLNRSRSGPDCLERVRSSSELGVEVEEEEVVVRRPAKTGSTAIRRRQGKRMSRSKVKRRCSINGHFYDRETSFFTPPHGCQTSVWVTSLVNTHEVINLMLEKYKVDSDWRNFALFIVRDNGEQRRLKEDDYPLLARVLLGPHEDVAKLFLMDSNSTLEVTSEVAQFLNLSLVECRAILNQYYTQEEKEIARIREKYYEMKRRMVFRMDELKASL